MVGTPAAAGVFRSGEHHTEGRAAVVHQSDDERYLTLTPFDTSAGPDLRVRLVPGRSDDGGADAAIDLGRSRATAAISSTARPAGADEGIHSCHLRRAFSVPFGSALVA